MSVMVKRESWSHRRKIGTTFVALVVVVGTLVGVLVSTRSSSGFYLVIGASAAKGFEPIGTMGPRGPNEAATDNGYANDLDAMLAAKGSSLTLDNIACPGETIQTFVNGGDACSPSLSQLDRAEKLLRHNSGENGVVTIDVGFNNIRPCLQFSNVDASCVASSVQLIDQYLPKALAGLQKAAGPGVTLVGVPYGDPFLGHYVAPTLGPANATATLRAMTTLDAALDRAFRAANIRIAPVVTALKTSDAKMTGEYEGRLLPQNVAMACETTWMCRAAPWGPNDHPDNEGYSIIAKAIEGVLPSSL
jgi:lysophospholipase L1-like esterase